MADYNPRLKEPLAGLTLAALGVVYGDIARAPFTRKETFNPDTKKLAGWAAIIAVPTLIAGIYGMNFKGMPEYDLPYGYPICIAVMLTLDVVLYLWFKKIKWL